MPRNRELEDVAEQNVEDTESPRRRDTGGVLNKMLLYPGVLLSVSGFGGSVSLFSIPGLMKLLNQYIFHLGHWKWVLHSALWLLGLLGLAVIYCAYPRSRRGVRKACHAMCCAPCMLFKKKKKQYEALINTIDEDEAAAAQA